MVELVVVLKELCLVTLGRLCGSESLNPESNPRSVSLSSSSDTKAASNAIGSANSSVVLNPASAQYALNLAYDSFDFCSAKTFDHSVRIDQRSFEVIDVA